MEKPCPLTASQSAEPIDDLVEIIWLAIELGGQRQINIVGVNAARSDDNSRVGKAGGDVERHNLEAAKRITDYVLVTLRGLSSYACLGYSTERLTECAVMAGRALHQDFN